MTIPTTDIKFSKLQTEYGGSNPISMSEYYSAGSYVPPGEYGVPDGVVTAIPTAGKINVNVFKGSMKRAAVPNSAYSSYCAGYPAGGRGPRSSPGYIYDTANNQNGYYDYCACARRWYSPAYAWGGATWAYSWTKALAFVHPYTNITAAQANDWGFDATDVVRADTIVFTSVSLALDDYAAIGYSLLNKSAVNIASATGATTLASWSDPGSGRHSYSSTLNKSIPSPDVNTLLFFWLTDNLGTNSTTFNVNCTSYGTLA